MVIDITIILMQLTSKQRGEKASQTGLIQKALQLIENKWAKISTAKLAREKDNNLHIYPFCWNWY